MPIESLVYDVGAHRGEDTEFYLNKGFSVIAIEASPNLCSQLSERFKDHVQGGLLKVLNVAIYSATIGEIDFYMEDGNTLLSTTNLDWVRRNKMSKIVKKIKVKAMTLNDVMKEHGVPRYCKIDIEGSDLDALKSLTQNLELPQFISIESERKHWNKLLEEFRTFRALGYSRYKIIDQSLIEFQVCPETSLEGRYFDHRFQFGSSGLFGNDLPGPWLDALDAIEMYKSIFRGYALNGEENGLFREGGMFNWLGRIDKAIGRLRGSRTHINPAYILPPPGWYDTHAAR